MIYVPHFKLTYLIHVWLPCVASWSLCIVNSVILRYGSSL